MGSQKEAGFPVVVGVVLVLALALASCSAAEPSSGTTSPEPQTTISTGTTVPPAVGATWEQRRSAGPDMVVEFSMVYVPDVDRFIAFGGRDSSFDPVDETWVYDPTTDVWVDGGVEEHPPWRSNHSMVFDSRRGRILLFGGDNLSRGFNDLWEFDPEENRWTEIAASNPPPARQMHGMAYDSDNDVVIVFGGRRTNGGPYFNDTWVYDPTTDSWRRVEVTSPPPVQDHVNLTYDETHRTMVLYDASSNRGPGDARTWTFDYETADWTAVVSDASPDSDHSVLMHDPATGLNVLVGNASESPGTQSWLFDAGAGAWSPLTTAPAPTYREHFGMALDTNRGVVVLTGGLPNSDQWALTLRGAPNQ